MAQEFMSPGSESLPSTTLRADEIAAHGKYDVLKRLTNVGLVLASAVPIWAMTFVARALAGKHTTIAATFTVSVVLTVGVSVGLIRLIQTRMKQERVLRERRERIRTLESENRELRREVVQMRKDSRP